MSFENPNAGEDLNALEGIISNYRSEIDDNAILHDDFEKLKDYLALKLEHTPAERTQLLGHILMELGESADDNLRMSEESPQIDRHEAETVQHLENQETLRDALHKFGLRYLN
ncbi:hypothetical protein [Pseudovibrio sp. Tun.PSC04-5.I4]|uniref:hypothetical protein n=1 Tax=Pseudovibrio sp. Tun.PSC04-5.I4 TaxID=1798213 RepID=UPI000889320D|nr:hypothetical protein [Pseudovibrio sp. Tun.PSC04-5.I4]SDR38403.1 hypothetical protein SAMN04515695_5188 [Pseudovibrio sp. Tun.PSC04-5.I4]